MDPTRQDEFDAWLAERLAEDPSLGGLKEQYEAAQNDRRRPWQETNLALILDGQRKRPEPTVGARTDGHGLFYPAKCHTAAGESESGKTWLALATHVAEADRGNHSVFIDFEDDEHAFVTRVLAMGAKPDQISKYLHYVSPTAAIGRDGVNRDDLRAILYDHNPTTFVTLDGVTEALTMHGYDANKNNEVAEFGRLLPIWIARQGPAVLSLDHVVKSGEARGRYAIGAVHKLNGLNGAAYTVVNRQPFGIGRRGVSYVYIQKDRPAQLRRHAVESGVDGHRQFWFADLVVDSTGDQGIETDVEIQTPVPADDKPLRHMALIMDLIEEKGALSKRLIRAGIPGNTARIDMALDTLILDEYLTQTTPHAVLKPWNPEGA